MGPVGVVAAAGLRRRWPTLVLSAVALGLTGAVVLASVAGSRRGRDALDEFVEHYRPGDIQAFVNPALPVDQQERTLRRMVDAAGDEPSASSATVVVAVPGPDGLHGDGTDLMVAEAYLRGEPFGTINRVKEIDGDLPLGDDEVAVNDRLADRRGLEVGDELTIDVFPREAIDRVGNGDLVDPAAELTYRVGLVMRSPFDLARSPQAQPGTLFESDESRLVLPPSFWADHGGDLAMYGMQALVQAGPADRGDVVAAMQEAGGDQVLVTTGASEDVAKLGPVGDAIDLEANAVLAFAAAVLVFGLAVLGAAAGRATRDDDERRGTLRALGLTRAQVARSALVRSAGMTVVATIVAVGGAIALSGAFPIGLARDAELHPGTELDPVVVLIGGVAFAALVAARLALAAWTGRGATGRRARPLTVVPLTPGGLGSRLAVDGLGRAGRGSSRVALATAVAGVGAVVAAVTFAASLDHLDRHPALQGWTWDVVVGNYSDPDTAAGGREALEANPDVASFSGFNWSTYRIDGHDVPVAELEHPERVTTVIEGRAPTGDAEIALGRGTLDQLGKEIGDTVRVSATAEPVPATVVGVVVTPATIVFPMDLDSGAVATFPFVARVVADQPNPNGPEGFLVQFAPGRDRAEALARLEEDFPRTVLGPMQPLDLQDLERVRGFPYVLAGLLGLLALVSTVVSLATLARRRRRDLAVLRALGLARRQLRRLVAGEASTFLVLALAIGVPVGVVTGRLAWMLAADGLGSVVGPLVPMTTIVVACLGLLVVVNAYGQGLATAMARRKPGADLREE